jgi:hypothetical protein
MPPCGPEKAPKGGPLLKFRRRLRPKVQCRSHQESLLQVSPCLLKTRSGPSGHTTSPIAITPLCLFMTVCRSTKHRRYLGPGRPLGPQKPFPRAGAVGPNLLELPWASWGRPNPKYGRCLINHTPSVDKLVVIARSVGCRQGAPRRFREGTLG